MSAEVKVEARIWCPLCREVKGEIQRIPADNEGVFVHRVVPENLGKRCACGTVLERKHALVRG